MYDTAYVVVYYINKIHLVLSVRLKVVILKFGYNKLFSTDIQVRYIQSRLYVFT